MHAEIKIGDSSIMLADEFIEMGFKGPVTLGGTSVSIMLYVDEVDSIFEKAIEAGANEIKPLADQFYGDRSGTIADPFGHMWTIATRIEDLSPDEVLKRYKDEMGL